jgi:hypothetical protein
VTTTVLQAYRFALDPTPEQDAVLGSHCGGSGTRSPGARISPEGLANATPGLP